MSGSIHNFFVISDDENVIEKSKNVADILGGKEWRVEGERENQRAKGVALAHPRAGENDGFIEQ